MVTFPQSASPPFADNVVRPFTSQGSSSRSPLQLLSYATHSEPRPDHRPSSADGSPTAKLGPYLSASARTSYTRVDVDSLPSPEYPPLPPLPTAFPMQQGDPPFVTPPDDLPDPTATTPANATAPTLATQPPDGTEPPIPQTPQVSLTFLLISGLRKTQTFEPEITVGRVKELVWNAWPARDADWQDERPPAPSYLRILYLGKILQDDDTLLRTFSSLSPFHSPSSSYLRCRSQLLRLLKNRDDDNVDADDPFYGVLHPHTKLISRSVGVGFPTSIPSSSNAVPTIVHLSIRPYALPSDDPALNKKKRLSVAFTRRLSTAPVVREVERDSEAEASRTGCCTGCLIC